MDFDIVDDLRDLRLERPAAVQKTPEELEKLTVDERLSGVERAVYLLTSGQEIQKVSVVSQLSSLICSDSRDECMKRVVPKIRELLPVAQAELQSEACSIFQKLIKEGTVSNAVFAQTFLPSMLGCMDSKDADMAELWLDALMNIMTLIPPDAVRRDILPKAVSKGQISQQIPSRLISCQLLGKISLCLDSAVLHKDVLPLVRSLCQDVEYEVRACMCRQLRDVAEGLSADDRKSVLLPELIELASDEESSVRVAGLESIVSTVPLLDRDTCSGAIVPLAVKCCQQAVQHDDAMLTLVSRLFGKLLFGLKGQDCLSLNQKDWFLDCYKKLCSSGVPEVAPPLLAKSKGDTSLGDGVQRSVTKSSLTSSTSYSDEERFTECRINCAYNFPAMVDFVGGKAAFEPSLYDTFSKLCRDSSASVRRVMAAGCHELTTTLGIPFSQIAKDFVCLLRDDSLEVLRGVVSHLSDALDALSMCQPQSSPAVTGGSSRTLDGQNLAGTPSGSASVAAPALSSAELMSAVLACDSVIAASHDWRLQEELLLKMAALTKCCTNDHIYSRLVPSLMHRLQYTARAFPVRRVAARTLLTVLRQLKRLEQREKVCSQIVNEFCKGKSFRHRALFIDMCNQALDLYSHRFFKEHWFEPSLELAADTVADIRLRLCSLLPRLKRAVRLPADRALLQQLEACVRRLLINERDKVVLASLRATVDDLDRTQCIIDSVITNSRTKYSPSDAKELAEDRKKEDEERLLIDQEEKDTREEEEKSKNDKKSLATTKSRPNVEKDKGKKGTVAVSTSVVSRPGAPVSTVAPVSAGRSSARTIPAASPASSSAATGGAGTSRTPASTVAAASSASSATDSGSTSAATGGLTTAARNGRTNFSTNNSTTKASVRSSGLKKD